MKEQFPSIPPVAESKPEEKNTKGFFQKIGSSKLVKGVVTGLGLYTAGLASGREVSAESLKSNSEYTEKDTQTKPNLPGLEIATEESSDGIESEKGSKLSDVMGTKPLGGETETGDNSLPESQKISLVKEAVENADKDPENAIAVAKKIASVFKKEEGIALARQLIDILSQTGRTDLIAQNMIYWVLDFYFFGVELKMQDLKKLGVSLEQIVHAHPDYFLSEHTKLVELYGENKELTQYALENADPETAFCYAIALGASPELILRLAREISPIAFFQKLDNLIVVKDQLVVENLILEKLEILEKDSTFQSWTDIIVFIKNAFLEGGTPENSFPFSLPPRVIEKVKQIIKDHGDSISYVPEIFK